MNTGRDCVNVDDLHFYAIVESIGYADYFRGLGVTGCSNLWQVLQASVVLSVDLPLRWYGHQVCQMCLLFCRWKDMVMSTQACN